MTFSPAVFLLDAIQFDRGVETGFTRIQNADSSDHTWLVVARGNGQIWKVEHPDFIRAVAMLEKMIGDQPQRTRSGASESPPHSTRL